MIAFTQLSGDQHWFMTKANCIEIKRMSDSAHNFTCIKLLGSDGENGPLSIRHIISEITTALQNRMMMTLWWATVSSRACFAHQLPLLQTHLVLPSFLIKPGPSLGLFADRASLSFPQEGQGGCVSWGTCFGASGIKRKKKKRAKAVTSTELTAQITQQLFSNLVIAGEVNSWVLMVLWF